MQRTGITALGSVLLAFLATQHHTIHMLILTLGLGGAGMSAMTAFPLVRRAMLLMALLMVGITIRQLWRHHPTFWLRVSGAISIVVTLSLMIWTTLQFGV